MPGKYYLYQMEKTLQPESSAPRNSYMHMIPVLYDAEKPE